MAYADSMITSLFIEILYGKKPESPSEAFQRDLFLVTGAKSLLDSAAHRMPTEDRNYYSAVIKDRIRHLAKSPFFSRLTFQRSVGRHYSH